MVFIAIPRKHGMEVADSPVIRKRPKRANQLILAEKENEHHKRNQR